MGEPAAGSPPSSSEDKQLLDGAIYPWKRYSSSQEIVGGSVYSAIDNYQMKNENPIGISHPDRVSCCALKFLLTILRLPFGGVFRKLFTAFLLVIPIQ